MTDSDAATGSEGMIERRAEARDKARQLRATQKKKDRRTRLLLQGGLGIAAIAVVAIVAVVIVGSVRPEGPGPRNMASDGIRFDAGFAVQTTAGLEPGEAPTPSEPSAAGVVDVVVFTDYLCPVCADFQTEMDDLLTTLVDSGAATLEIHPLATLTNRSAGTQYSLRAANAAACTANFAPAAFPAVNAALFAAQPEPDTEGLADGELLDLVREAGADSGSMERCIEERRFAPWVEAATTRAQAGPLPVASTEVESLGGTPLVLVNGVRYPGTDPFDAADFSQFILQAAGGDVDLEPSPSPSPSPSPAAP